MALGKGKKKNVTGPKKAAARSAGVKTTQTRKAGPKRTRAKTTTRSGDR